MKKIEIELEDSVFESFNIVSAKVKMSTKKFIEHLCDSFIIENTLR